MAHIQHNPVADQPCTRAQLMQLNEEQVLHMNSEYMGEAQKNYFRSLLIAQGAVMEAREKSAAAEIAIVSSEADPIDRASAEEEHQLAIASRARDAAHLIDVRAAIRRIDADEFGWCIETGDVIGIGRLLICPTTMLCVEAQQRRERLTTRYRG